MTPNTNTIDIKEIYERLIALETKLDLIGITKLETLRELRVGMALLITINFILLFMHLYFFYYG